MHKKLTPAFGGKLHIQSFMNKAFDTVYQRLSLLSSVGFEAFRIKVWKWAGIL